jgi:hypothetical protein
MVIAGFFILTLIISVVLFLNRSSLVNSLLLLLYLASLWFTGIYGLLHKGEIDSWFFRPDALGILMVLALCIISIPSLYMDAGLLLLMMRLPVPEDFSLLPWSC